MEQPIPTANGSSLALLSSMDSLADGTRLRLMRLLERQELNVMDLCDILQLPQSTVSRHLKILSAEKWCYSQRQGTNNLYRMVLDELKPAMRKLWLLTREQTEAWPTLRQDELRFEARLAQKQSDSHAFFESAAGQWDRLRQELYGVAFESQAQIALLPRHWVIADLGCGTGTTTASLACHVQQIIGIDQSEAMLNAARQRTADLSNVQLRRGDLQAIPIDDDSCDAAILTLVLTYLADPLPVLRETARILKPGGRIVVTDLLLHDQDDFRRQMGQQSMGFTTDQIQQLFQAAGLVHCHVGELPPQHQAKGPALFLARASK